MKLKLSKNNIIWSLFILFGLLIFIEPALALEKLEDPLSDVTPQQLIGNVIKGLLGITGSIALLMFVYGGFFLLISGGNQERVKKGTDIIKWAVIGLFTIFLSYVIVDFVLRVATGG